MRLPLVHRPIPFAFGLALALVMAGHPAVAAKSEWSPITPADLAQSAPQVEKDADAEALFWNVRVEDAISGQKFLTVVSQEVRIKVFTAHGAETQSRVEIPFGDGTQVDEIAARTVLPNGKIVELKKEDVFENTLVKARGRKVRAKTFALPAVEPGAILDYRWRETRYEQLSINARLPFQRDIPVQRLVYRLKPLAIPWEANYTMKTTMFNGTPSPFDHEPDGFFRIAMANVRSFWDEPDMPPGPQVKPWMLVWYGESTAQSPDKFWIDYGRRRYQADHPFLKTTKELRDAAATIAAGATDPEQKLEKLHDFCRTQIRNLSDDAAELTAENQSKLQAAKNPGETYQKKRGTGWDVDCLFAALAIASGFDARLAWSGDRSDMAFDPKVANDAFMDQYCVAVKVSDQWRFFDPAVTYVPFGMLPWWLEGTTILVPDEKLPIMVNTANSPSTRSRCRRIANLKLAPNGDLSGDCRIEYTGHWGHDMKEQYDDESAEDRERALVDLVEGAIGSATVTNVAAVNVTDPQKPFTWFFHLEAPGYAQAAGSRLFLQPGVFQHTSEPRFTASRRRYPVQFDFMWSEDDSVTIELPPGATVEAVENPPSLPIGNFAELAATATTTAEGRLVYRRTFHFDRLSFGIVDYPRLKEDFERIHQVDSHSLALRVSGAAGE